MKAPMRIAVIGYSGSGKSTLAKTLSEIHRLPLLYLDTVQFLPGWEERAAEAGRDIVREFMKKDSWVIDGNYRKYLEDERLEAATQIVMLDFNRFVCFFQAYRRYLRHRNKSRESMTEGCDERFDREFALWILFVGRTKEKRHRYHEIEALYKDKIVVLKNRRSVDRFLSQERNAEAD